MAKASAVQQLRSLDILARSTWGLTAAPRSNERLILIASHVGVRPSRALVSGLLPRFWPYVSRAEVAAPQVIKEVDAGLEIAAVVQRVDELSSSALST